MIQFNKTFFQFTKRLALVVTFISLSSATLAGGFHGGVATFWGDGGTHTSTITVTTNRPAAGSVYVNTSEIQKDENDAYNVTGLGQSLSTSCTDYLDGWGAFDDYDSHTYYAVAIPNENVVYLWDGWYDNNTQISQSTAAVFNINADPNNNNSKNDDSAKKTYTARWLCPTVESVSPSSHEKTINNKTPYEAPVNFTVTEALSVENFTYNTSNNNFGYKDISLADNTLTMNYTYTPTGVHTAHNQNVTWYSEHATPNVGTLTLTSKYRGSAENPSAKSFTLTVKEDYTPWFEMTNTEVTFENTLPGSSTSNLVNNAKLEPNSTTWNYAASQGIPTTDEGTDPNSSDDDKLVNGCIWTVWIDGTNADCFSISGTPEENGKYHPANGKPIVTFTPPIEVNADQNNFTATLHITCEYYDAEGNIIPALGKNGETWNDTKLERAVTLNGEAIVTPSVLIGNSTNATILFDNVVCGTPLKYSDGSDVEIKSISYITNIENLTETFPQEDQYITITPDRSTTKTISALLSGDITPGTHTATFKTEGIVDGHDYSATLTVTANVILTKPVLSGYAGNASVHLEWEPVPGATGYTLYYQQSETITVGQGTSVDCNTNTTADINLENDKLYSFIVVAEYDNNTSLNQKSNIVTLRPTDFPETIDYSNRVTTLYTGTEGHEGAIDGSDFPYMTLRKVDVTAAFSDATTQTALFDYLVIFGKTAFGNGSHTPTSTAPASAETPCYIYEKQPDDKTYKIRKMGNENYINMNRDNKHPGFTIDATQDRDKSLSIYFTGFCPFASTGSSWDENAVVHITGNSETQVDIYLDNAQIFARPKRHDGTIDVGFQTAHKTFSQSNGGFMEGSGAVFAFTSTIGTFEPTIHICNKNILQSHLGVSATGQYTRTEQNVKNIFEGNYTQHSSPIQVLPTNLSASTKLVIDDRWNNARTNGMLSLQVNENSSAPLVDLGNEYSSLFFKGGQIYLKNHPERLVAAYKKCVRTEKVKVQNDGVFQDEKFTEISTTIYGATTANATYSIGTAASHDENAGLLLSVQSSMAFIDGTFTAQNTLTVPAETKIDGGSYPACEFATTMKNTYGKELHKIPANITSDVATIDNGLAVFTDGLIGFKKLMDNVYPDANWHDETTELGAHFASLSTYYDGGNHLYGYSSLAPDATNTVYLMLPKDGDPTIKQWAVSGPAFEATIGGTTTNIQREPITIHCTSQTEANTFGKTYKMLYVETDGYTASAIPAKTDEGNKYQLSYGASSDKTITATITSDFAPAVINNQQNYIVSDKVYMMKPIVATDWMLFCPPFDVANIYIIEAYPEAQLIKDFATTPDKNGNITSIKTPEEIAAARKAQSQRWMDLYLWWWNYANTGTNAEDFFAEDGYSSFVDSWMDYEQKKTGTTNAAYTPVIDKLCHFMGKDAQYPGGLPWYNAAHYYLYESNGAWQKVGDKYETTWETVKQYPNGKEAIMKAGKVYALNFPYNTIGGHNPNTTWDYWTGKYILIESTTKTNGHTIRGAEYDMIGIKSTEDGKNAWLCGNATFADKSITDTDADQVWTVKNYYGGSNLEDETIAVNTHTVERQNANQTVSLKPTQSFLLASPTAQANMIAKTINYRTGEIIYEKLEDPNTGDIETGLPTITNGMTLIVEPTAEGLTITPIKEQQVMLFDAGGKMIFSKHLSAEENVTLPTGVYVVRGEYEQVKAIKK